VFARPPRSSHEVLQPDAYINQEKLPPVRIPDMQALLAGQYDAYDSGGVGEVDIRALLKQYGERKIADDLSSAWQGGAYVTYRRKETAMADVPASTAELALLYISYWKTAQAAERFARFYAGSVSQRYRSAIVQEVQACSGTSCPVSIAQIVTEEGPVIVEHRKDAGNDNSVIVSEGFDTQTASKLRTALRDRMGAAHAENLPQEEIGFRLLEIPAFRAFAEKIGKRVRDEMSRETGR